MAKNYYKVIFSDFSDTVGYAKNMSAMRADANRYIRMWDLDISVSQIVAISESEYKNRSQDTKTQLELGKI